MRSGDSYKRLAAPQNRHMIISQYAIKGTLHRNVPFGCIISVSYAEGSIAINLNS